MAKKRQYRAAYLFVLPFFVIFLAMIIVPLAYAGYLSFFKEQLVGGTSFAGFANYTRALTDPFFLSGVARVALFLVIQVPIMLALSLFFALALDSGMVRLAKLVRLGIYVPYAVPAVVATLMWGYLYGRDFGPFAQLAATVGLPPPPFLEPKFVLFSIVNVVNWEFIGYNMIIIYAALRSISTDLYEAARVDGASEPRIAWSIKIPAVRPALILTVIFSVIGSFQLFNEPNLLRILAPNAINSSYTPNLYAYTLAFVNQDANYAAAIAFLLGIVIMALSYAVQLWTQRKENAVMTTLATSDLDVAAATSDADRLNPPQKQRKSTLLTVIMLLCTLYFLLPLYWLLVASTKSNADLFSTFGLWFADFSLMENLKNTFTIQDGVFSRWILNSVIYSVTSAVGATLLATAAGYAFAKYRFPGGRALFSIILGAIMIPTTALAIPTYLLFARARADRHLLGDHPALAGQPLRRLPDAGLRRRRGGLLPDRSRPRGRSERDRDLLPGGVPAADARRRHRAAVQPGGDLEQLLPAADHAELAGEVPDPRRAGAVAVHVQCRLGRPGPLLHRDHRIHGLRRPADPGLRLPPALLAVGLVVRRRQSLIPCPPRLPLRSSPCPPVPTTSSSAPLTTTSTNPPLGWRPTST